jgi:hypothetical protein
MLTTQKRAADRCLDAIKVLADRQRVAAAIRDGRDPESLSTIEKSDDAVRTAAPAPKVAFATPEARPSEGRAERAGDLAAQDVA